MGKPELVSKQNQINPQKQFLRQTEPYHIPCHPLKPPTFSLLVTSTLPLSQHTLPQAKTLISKIERPKLPATPRVRDTVKIHSQLFDWLQHTFKTTHLHNVFVNSACQNQCQLLLRRLSCEYLWRMRRKKAVSIRLNLVI